MRWKALAEIYTMHSFAPFWNRIPKTRRTVGRKEPAMVHTTPGKNGQEKLISSRSSLLSTNYLRAKDEECLRIRNKVLTGDFQFNSM